MGCNPTNGEFSDSKLGCNSRLVDNKPTAEKLGRALSEAKALHRYPDDGGHNRDERLRCANAHRVNRRAS